jgi:hypothetical protein
VEVATDAAQRQGSAPAARRADPVLLLLVVAIAASAALLLALGSRLTFLLDDWEFLLYRPGWTAHSILSPHNEHISIIPIVVYKTLQATLGMDSAFPYRVVSTMLFLLSAVLLFVWLRQRVDDWPALIAVTLILFLGAAWEDLLWPFQIAFFGSMVFGLGMLLALEREDRVGDRLACGLLTGSIAFSSLGLPFLAGAAVDLYQRRQEWRSRFFVLAVPILLYGLWWIGWGHNADNHLSLHNLATTPRFVFDAIAGGTASLFGLASPTPEAGVGGLDWGRPILLVALLLAGWRLHMRGSASRWLWVVGAIGLTFWFLAGVNLTEGRGPTASRYQYPSAIFILLIAAELLHGLRIGRRALIVIGVLGTAAVASNIAYLHDSYKAYKKTSDLEKADLGAVEIARRTVNPGFVLDEDIADTAYVHVDANSYLTAADKYGSPADSPAEIADAPETARVAADQVLAAALRVKLSRSEGESARTTGPAPQLIEPRTALEKQTPSCTTVIATRSDSPLLSLPPGGAILRSHANGGAGVRLRRFATNSLPVDVGKLSAGAGAVLEIPTDRATEQWKLSLQGSGAVTVCGR